MTRTATMGLAMVGAFIVLLVAASLAFIDLHGDGVAAGMGIGAALGLVNLAVGALVTRRSLRQGMKSVTATLVGGFAARLVVLVALFLIFQQSHAADPAAFGLTFMAFFFVYLGVELFMVERTRTGVERARTGVERRQTGRAA